MAQAYLRSAALRAVTDAVCIGRLTPNSRADLPLPQNKVDRALAFIGGHAQPDGVLGMADPGIPDYPNSTPLARERVWPRAAAGLGSAGPASGRLPARTAVHRTKRVACRGSGIRRMG